ncbi:hypothetical protein [Pseudomonas typographi]|uniref:hypothetical protein n=1 Tax=Pseudomonas typographi TaxID=2715964 RepID=UPI001682597F|nr:hypothetical protein [Pseudomonas typographi]MBD1549966.1 hypothetical protein [Pseudomonas typographi]MBD1585347.1 hypothetical protein [Pseudomonas typographi]
MSDILPRLWVASLNKTLQSEIDKCIADGEVNALELAKFRKSADAQVATAITTGASAAVKEALEKLAKAADDTHRAIVDLDKIYRPLEEDLKAAIEVAVQYQLVQTVLSYNFSLDKQLVYYPEGKQGLADWLKHRQQP